MKRVYVAGLYSRTADGGKADVIQVLKNIRDGQAVSLKVLRLGFAVFCPWLDYQFALLDDDPIPVEVYKENSMAWVEVSDYMLVISGVGLGSGVDAEIETARKLGIPVYFKLDDLVAQL